MKNDSSFNQYYQGITMSNIFNLSEFNLEEIVNRAMIEGKYGILTRDELIRYLSSETNSYESNGIEQKLLESGYTFGYSKNEILDLLDQALDAWDNHNDFE